MHSEPRSVPRCDWCEGLLAETIYAYRERTFCCERHRERWLTENRRMPIQWQRWIPATLVEDVG